MELCLNRSDQTSLVAQWERIYLPMQVTRVQSLVQEDPLRRGTATPVHRPQRPAGSTHSSTRGLRPLLSVTCNYLYTDTKALSLVQETYKYRHSIVWQVVKCWCFFFFPTQDGILLFKSYLFLKHQGGEVSKYPLTN